MERFAGGGDTPHRGLGRAVDGHPVCSGLGDGQVAEADLGRGVEVDGAQVRAADGEAGDVDVGDAAHQDPEVARTGLDAVSGARVRPTDVDVQQLGDAVVEPGAGRRRGGGRGHRQRLAVEPDLGGRGARRERVLPGRGRGGGPAGRAGQVVGAEDHRVRRGGVHGQRGTLLAAAGGHGELLAVGAGPHQHRVAGLRLLRRGADRAERDGLAAGAAVGAQCRRAGDVVGLEHALGDHLVGARRGLLAGVVGDGDRGVEGAQAPVGVRRRRCRLRTDGGAVTEVEGVRRDAGRVGVARPARVGGDRGGRRHLHGRGVEHERCVRRVVGRSRRWLLLECSAVGVRRGAGAGVGDQRVVDERVARLVRRGEPDGVRVGGVDGGRAGGEPEVAVGGVQQPGVDPEPVGLLAGGGRERTDRAVDGAVELRGRCRGAVPGQVVVAGEARGGAGVDVQVVLVGGRSVVDQHVVGERRAQRVALDRDAVPPVAPGGVVDVAHVRGRQRVEPVVAVGPADVARHHRAVRARVDLDPGVLVVVAEVAGHHVVR